MSRTRVYEIAKQFNCGSKDLAVFIMDLGINIRGHSSTLSESEVEIVIHEFMKRRPFGEEVLDEFDINKSIEEAESAFLKGALSALATRINSSSSSEHEYTPPKNLKEIHISSWNDFLNTVRGLSYREWVFRGQSDASWKLETSIFRAFRDITPLRSQNSELLQYIARNSYESILIDHFKSNAHLHLNQLPSDDDKLEWLSIMQHYGAPTRMLDFTYSPYIALFFGLNDGTTDSSVYCFQKTSITGFSSREKLEEKVLDGNLGEDSFLITYEPKKTNLRLHNQQGLFIVPRSLSDFYPYQLDG